MHFFAWPLLYSQALLPRKLFDLDEIRHTHSGGVWIITWKVSICYVLCDLRFSDWKQNSRVGWAFLEICAFLAWPLLYSQALLPRKLFDLDEIRHTHSGGVWIITWKVSICYVLCDLRFSDWKQNSRVGWASLEICAFLGWPLFSSLAILPWKLLDLD